jgi:hypothetical protein
MRSRKAASTIGAQRGGRSYGASADAKKRLIRHALDSAFDAIYEESRQLLATCLASPEAIAGHSVAPTS